MKVLDKHAQRKEKIARGNQMSFMMKHLFKEIMKMPRLRKRFLKNESPENRILYTEQKNYCESLLKRLRSSIAQKAVLTVFRFLSSGNFSF